MSSSPVVPVLPLFGQLFQICHVTLDLDAAMARLQRAHGIRAFRVKRDVSSLPGMPSMAMHQAHVFVGRQQIELIQPAGGDDGLYRALCPADPAALAFHHFGIWAEPAQYDGLRTAAGASGLPIVFELDIPGVARAMYLDARATLGHYLEYVCMPEAVREKYYADVPCQ